MRWVDTVPHLNLHISVEEYMEMWETMEDRWNTVLRPYSPPARISKRIQMLKTCWKRDNLPDIRFHDWEILVGQKARGYSWRPIEDEEFEDCIMNLNLLNLDENQRTEFIEWCKKNKMKYAVGSD